MANYFFTSWNLTAEENATLQSEDRSREGVQTLGSEGEQLSEGEMETQGTVEGDQNGCQCRWWLAASYPKAKQLLLRQATTGDKKKQGAARTSQYYRKHGNPNLPGRKTKTTDLR